MYVKTADGLGIYNCDGFYVEDEDLHYAVKGCLVNGGTVELSIFTSMENAKEAISYLSSSLLSSEKVVTSPLSVLNDADNIERFKA